MPDVVEDVIDRSKSNEGKQMTESPKMDMEFVEGGKGKQRAGTRSSTDPIRPGITNTLRSSSTLVNGSSST